MEFLKKLIEKKEQTANELRSKIDKCENVVEARALYAQLEVIKSEILEAQEELRNKSNGNGFEPMKSLGDFQIQKREQSDDVYGSLEYRKAFMDYIQKGVEIPTEFRAGGDTGTTVTTDIGKIIPTTVMQEIIDTDKKSYGQIYSRVRKLNLKGGVEFPIASLKANFKWVAEATDSDVHKIGDTKEAVVFSAHLGEIKISVSLVASVTSLDLFEKELVKTIMKAYYAAMDTAIISGTGSGQPLGITNDTRITGQPSQVIEFTEAEFKDWTKWRAKLFSKEAISNRGDSEFIFSKATVQGYLMTMQDANKRPLFIEAAHGSYGTERENPLFFGRTCIEVEPDIIKDFDTASNGDIVGVFWVPTDYAINSNMEFGIKRYVDEKNNTVVTKALTIADGKILDASGCFLIKKKV